MTDRPGRARPEPATWSDRARGRLQEVLAPVLRAVRGGERRAAHGGRTGDGDQDRTTAAPGAPAVVGAGVDDDVPTPLSTERIAAWLTGEGLPYFVDSDGDVGGIWGGRLFYAFCFGERAEILQVRGQWHRDLTIERLTEVLEVCNTWNADTILPKAYARVRDDGMVLVVAESATDLEHGVTDEQLGRLLRTGVAAAGALFDRLDQLYLDPVRVAP